MPRQDKRALLEMIKFGAEAAFRAEDAVVPDEDIDAILARGAATTAALDARIVALGPDEQSLLDFSRGPSRVQVRPRRAGVTWFGRIWFESGWSLCLIDICSIGSLV